MSSIPLVGFILKFLELKPSLVVKLSLLPRPKHGTISPSDQILTIIRQLEMPPQNFSFHMPITLLPRATWRLAAPQI